jgi:Xaa-Pro aminopeptidase
MSGFPDFDYQPRIDRARALMADRGVDGLLVSVGSEMPYLVGYEATPLERLTMLVITATAAELFVPELEAPRVIDRGVVSIHPWGETADPVALVASMLGDAARCAIGDKTWSRFTLALQAAVPGAEFINASAITDELRIRKDAAEIGLLRAAAEATDRVAARLAEIGFSGRSELSLATLVNTMTVEEGHDTASFAIVASGPNAASPHHEPGDRIMGEGDTVVVDFGGRLSGYCSDTTRTFIVGQPTTRIAEAHAVLRTAQEAARAVVAPGVPAEAVDRAARDVIDAAGFGDFFIHRTGHGIGLEVHEEPYLVGGNARALEPGMAFSIEPGIYLPGEWGMRIEDIVVCGDDRVDELNRSDRSLISVA